MGFDEYHATPLAGCNISDNDVGLSYYLLYKSSEFNCWGTYSSVGLSSPPRKTFLSRFKKTNLSPTWPLLWCFMFIIISALCLTLVRSMLYHLFIVKASLLLTNPGPEPALNLQLEIKTIMRIEVRLNVQSSGKNHHLKICQIENFLGKRLMRNELKPFQSSS